MSRKKLTLAGILVLSVIALQGFYLYRLSDRVTQLSQASEPGSSKQQIASTTPTPDPLDLFDGKDWSPFKEMQRMQNAMDKMFDNMQSQIQLAPGFKSLNNTFSFSPEMDVKDEKDKIVVTADIPGADESNINVTVEDQQLTIVAKTKKSSEQKGKNSTYLSERFIGSFQRSVTLPEPVIASKMKTDYEDGVLTVTIPKV